MKDGHQTHFTVPDLPWKKGKKSSPKTYNFQEFRHIVNATFVEAELFYKPNKQHTPDIWIQWLIDNVEKKMK